MGSFAGRLAEPDSFSAPADIVKRSFARFVRPDGEGLFDVIDGPNGNDDSVRPNQILAVSLPHSPLNADDQAKVVRVCKRHLLTAYGLRSLAPGSPQYHTRYGAASSNAMAVITRGRSGPGFSDRSASPSIELPVTQRRRKLCSCR
jgi:predicted glycogen debranching enzyme